MDMLKVILGVAWLFLRVIIIVGLCVVGGYCPLYMLGDACGGNFTYTENGVKNCTDCMVPHTRNAVQYILKRWPDIAARAKKQD